MLPASNIISCKLCTVTFSRQAELRRHQQETHGSRFLCNFCNWMGSKRQYRLFAHLDKYHQITMKASTQIQYKVHGIDDDQTSFDGMCDTSMGNDGSMSPSSFGQFPCEDLQCSENFSTDKSRLSHYQGAHFDIVRCTEVGCRVPSVRTIHFERHMRAKHPGVQRQTEKVLEPYNKHSR